MSVATKNPFAIFGDDDGDSAPAAPKAAPAAAAPAAAAAPKTSNNNGASRGGRNGEGRGGRGGERRGRGGSFRPAQDGSRDIEGEPRKEYKTGATDSEHRTRGRGGGRGGRGDGKARGARRTFDRHNAGRPDSDKKVASGWGDNDGETELQAEEGAVLDAAADVATGGEVPIAADAAAADTWVAQEFPSGDGAPAADGAADAFGAAPAGGDRPPRRGRRGEEEEEEEDNTLTLDQYLAKKATIDGVPALERRQANEGQDADALWKDAIKKEGKDLEAGAYYAGKTKAAPKAKERKEKVLLETDFTFSQPSRGGRGGRGGGRGGFGGDRGDRGERFGGDRAERGDRPRGRGGRGGRGRGGYNGGNGNGASAAGPDVQDASAFPALS